ncbi:NUDIX hydrolase [Bacillus sp. CMF21]|uniref:NUDIX hydrolase n=1 Tax=Metabacillus dongyingensis TaxID=2874282 RepID=UPI001CC090DD|nr:NUDIX hydrolase [Metabacillus dongyingensis]UAL53574.1 NUDIX hydrolase [Metabacillus dongyingensis]UOK59037.1 NUDIX hydrolase [Bacillus sp. OVS6]USK29886.1 NUDIX hydrolase [Bacillus sp. CMF21]
MIYRRKTYKILPEKAKLFNQFFHDFLLPNQLKNGARLTGRWINETKDEIVAIWEYDSYEEYIKIEERVKKDKMHKLAAEKLKTFGTLFTSSEQDFLNPAGNYHFPRHTVTVSGYITNKEGEVLLVNTFWRTDTWELPGGAVDEGETLDTALCREILEETGIEVKLHGVSGVYSNGTTITIVFIGSYKGGKVMPSDETKEAGFHKLDSSNIENFVTRAKYQPRVKDAMSGRYIPYEAFKVRPYELLNRMGDS